jgi:hypothetical protein
MICRRFGNQLVDAVSNGGSTADERGQAYPCDRYQADPDAVLFRAIDVEAPVPTMYSWLCQLRAAPYSYDWIDNRGRTSPRSRDPELEQLEVGQTVMSMFRLVDFESDSHLTIWHDGRRFGEIAATYRVVPVGPERCRVVVKMLVRYPPRSPLSLVLRLLLPPGDLVMMRRQLRNLATLAALDSRSAVGSER